MADRIESRGDRETRVNAGGMPDPASHPARMTDGAGKTATGSAAPLGEVDPTVLFRPGQVVAGRFKVVRLIGHGG
ncbi:MAG: hypothetical protein JXR94_04745, partial [Candidatus Hydrogenedentes bacterium]|nr:hypothetical protein [Candidatus Hydrogenedentota bacterium]